MSSDFFDSPVVRAAAVEINELQEEIMKLMMIPPWKQTEDQKKRSVEVMKTLLDKQKVFWFRLKYSDDPKAVKMKEEIHESARFLGLKPNQSIEDFFDMLTKTLESLEDSVDK